eukprot:TRINITY_DN11723_c0_g1_i2.p1 TRINITY_DN11723_c0_g1~~TRINITY_DN11723_c0_g1_i2.p1  ORF type:complete len:190 (+),score=16.22 TRINITY_DN11723_c0_g1_i2:46-570(+)
MPDRSTMPRARLRFEAMGNTGLRCLDPEPPAEIAALPPLTSSMRAGTPGSTKSPDQPKCTRRAVILRDPLTGLDLRPRGGFPEGYCSPGGVSPLSPPTPSTDASVGNGTGAYESDSSTFGMLGDYNQSCPHTAFAVSQRQAAALEQRLMERLAARSTGSPSEGGHPAVALAVEA